MTVLRRRVRYALVALSTVGILVGASACGGRPAPPTDPSPMSPPTATAEPAPAPDVPGWKITAASTGLARVGLTCAGLPPYTGPSRPRPGTVIREQRIETTLDLSAGDVVIERSCIRPLTAGRGLPIVTTTDFNACSADTCPAAAGPVTLRDCEIDGSAIDTRTVAYSAAFSGVGTVQRCDIHDVGSGIAIYNAGDSYDALIDGNYVHHLRSWGAAAGDGSHSDGVTVRDLTTAIRPDRRATIRNNRIDCSAGNDTGALFIQASGSVDNLMIEGNLLEGQGYQLILESTSKGGYGKSLTAVDNRFSGTGYGPAYVSRGNEDHGWRDWKNNFINDPTAPDNRSHGVPDPS